MACFSFPPENKKAFTELKLYHLFYNFLITDTFINSILEIILFRNTKLTQRYLFIKIPPPARCHRQAFFHEVYIYIYVYTVYIYIYTVYTVYIYIYMYILYIYIYTVYTVYIYIYIYYAHSRLPFYKNLSRSVHKLTGLLTVRPVFLANEESVGSTNRV